MVVFTGTRRLHDSSLVLSFQTIPSRLSHAKGYTETFLNLNRILFFSLHREMVTTIPLQNLPAG